MIGTKGGIPKAPPSPPQLVRYGLASVDSRAVVGAFRWRVWAEDLRAWVVLCQTKIPRVSRSPK